MTEVTIIQLPRRLAAKQNFSKWMTENRNANKKEEINEGKMQIASVSRKKSAKIINLNWDNWLIHMTTTVVQIVLQKRNSFHAFVNWQEMQ